MIPERSEHLRKEVAPPQRGPEFSIFGKGIAMAAWVHKYGWNIDVYYRYRKYVMANGAGYEGSDRDCADVAMSLLIDFAASLNLCLTFRDATGGTYISKATGLIARFPSHPMRAAPKYISN
jgi:hypothetical protein